MRVVELWMCVARGDGDRSAGSRALGVTPALREATRGSLARLYCGLRSRVVESLEVTEGLMRGREGWFGRLSPRISRKKKNACGARDRGSQAVRSARDEGAMLALLVARVLAEPVRSGCTGAVPSQGAIPARC